jgi:hypothetical protein
LDISPLGGERAEDIPPTQINQLSSSRRDVLLRQGILVQDQWKNLHANWSVQKRYYWSQTFPAHATVHIRHEYSPVNGYSQIALDSLDPSSDRTERNPAVKADLRFNRNEFTSLCPSPEQVKNLSKAKGILFANWVDFILTTANTWKRPIEDFTLIIERTDPKDTVSFCWNGFVEKLDPNHFRAKATNLIPTKELHIGFYHLDNSDQ